MWPGVDAGADGFLEGIRNFPMEAVGSRVTLVGDVWKLCVPFMLFHVRLGCTSGLAMKLSWGVFPAPGSCLSLCFWRTGFW